MSSYDKDKDRQLTVIGEIPGDKSASGDDALPIVVSIFSYDGGTPKVAFQRKSSTGRTFPMKRVTADEAIRLGEFLGAHSEAIKTAVKPVEEKPKTATRKKGEDKAPKGKTEKK